MRSRSRLRHLNSRPRFQKMVSIQDLCQKKQSKKAKHNFYKNYKKNVLKSSHDDSSKKSKRRIKIAQSASARLSTIHRCSNIKVKNISNGVRNL